MLSGDYGAKVSREDIFKQKIENGSLQEISRDYGVRIINFQHLKLSQSKCNDPTTFHL
jgi:hypothetical protein